ncbi:hypothetical protein D6779_09850 [Candidatus Parcubacteria bacterium]|nr:MAG: hypothetical protein D6779_09850 [Candidatus Parcubacteria bacterium]
MTSGNPPRERTIRTNDAAALRLFSVLLAESHETWISRKYLEMDESHECLETRQQRQGEVVTMK